MLTDVDPYWGPRPVVGDLVYVDMGDSIQTGGEFTAVLSARSESQGVTMLAFANGEWIYDWQACHIEVVN